MNSTYCKHNMLIGTCAICEGLVRPSGELHYLWLDWCDTNYDLNVDNFKQHTSKEEWFKGNKRTLKLLFFEKWGQYPPYPTWPE